MYDWNGVHFVMGLDDGGTMRQAANRGAIDPIATLSAGQDHATVERAVSAEREIWSVIHESNRLNKRLALVQSWARTAVLKTQSALRDLQLPA